MCLSPVPPLAPTKTFSQSIETLRVIAVCNLELLRKASNRHQYVMVRTDQNLKLTRAACLLSTSPTYYAKYIYFDCWIILYRATTKVLTGNGPLFVNIFFANVSSSRSGIYHNSNVPFAAKRPCREIQQDDGHSTLKPCFETPEGLRCICAVPHICSWYACE